ncbi:Ribonuclease P protein component [Austwickia sp. TVS 96-490-7B]|uniref:ribonuclease P protein component n=1 Tax=Austwickia sp. TVS 96-490-7B TaxID=2830843 RepID=UPI001C594A23|nr:ribonuclease P protein component [Austwickia sp. TVS 96-490-7B]MBW3084170.1 Ribonuclease P protein component [Austwickia sp. TVS 96-490-7B]
MLPARHRLRDRTDITAAVRAQRKGGPHLVVHAINTGARAGAPPRVGFVVSKAVGTAVVRNRTKRRLRALMAPRMLLLPTGLDLVIRALPSAAECAFTQLQGDLDRQIAAVLRRTPVPSRALSGDGPSEQVT